MQASSGKFWKRISILFFWDKIKEALPLEARKKII